MPLLTLASLTSPSIASALQRTIRGRAYFNNERVNYSTAEGSRLTTVGSSGDTTASLGYITYIIFARCPNQTPLYGSGTKYAAANGYFNHTFDVPCSNPEYKAYFWMQSQIEGATFHSVKPDGAITPYVFGVPSDSSFVSVGTASSVWRSLNLSCREGWQWQCPGPDGSSEESHRVANIYKTAIDVYNVWGAYKVDEFGPFDIFWDSDSGDSGGTASGLNTVNLEEGYYRQNHGVAHELGHLYMKRAMAHSTRLGDPNWVSGHSWHFTSQSSQTAATSEGWADFFAAATYFEPSARQPYYSWCGDTCDDGAPTTCACNTYVAGDVLPPDCARRCRWNSSAGAFLESRQLLEERTWDRAWSQTVTNLACVRGDRGPTSSVAPHTVEGNVARFFWDLYDLWDPNDGADQITLTPQQILDVWDAMRAVGSGWGTGKVLEPECAAVGSSTCNGPAVASGGRVWDDPNGRNVYDYASYIAQIAPYVWQYRIDLEMSNNCLDDQDQF